MTSSTGNDLISRTRFAAPALTPSSDRLEDQHQRHSVARRFLERFAFVAFGLYHLPLFLNNYPSLGGGGFNDDGLAVRWGHVFTVPGIWIAHHLFGISGPMINAARGDNGDVAEEFARLLLAVALGAVVATWWTFADRRRPHASWVPETLRVLLRYSIALGLMSYGIAKILPMQFPPLSDRILAQRVGDLSPMALLWTFMEYSRPYAFFGGLMECVAVVLLCFRRTTTLGALVCLGVMTNVALLNFAYGIPVKLYSTMLVISAAVLVLYDMPRLTAVLVLNHPAPPAVERSYLHDHIRSSWRWAMKLVLVGSVVASSVIAMHAAVGGRRGSRAIQADTTYRLLRGSFHLISE